MAQLTKELQLLNRQQNKEQKEINRHKNSILLNIKKNSKETIKNTNTEMPQFSENYINETQGKPKDSFEDKPNLMEGYLSSLLNISDSLPFKTIKADMVFTLEKNTYVKILKEVERIKLGGDIEPEILEITPTFEVEVNEISFTFIMQIED